MSNESLRPIGEVLYELGRAEVIAKRADKMLEEALPLIIGKRIMYGGVAHQIVAARRGYGNCLSLTGVRCHGSKIGTRQFHCGYLEDISELFDGKQQ